jgi:hypothetical protein
MLVKNIFSNPIHGIAPGEEGELPKNRESRLNQYVKYGMLEIVGEEVETEQPAETEHQKQELTNASSKTEFSRSKVGDLVSFCNKEGIDIEDGASKADVLDAIFKEYFQAKEL